MRHYSLNDVLASVGERAFSRGATYHKQKRATVIDVADGQVVGRVQGTDRKPYTVRAYVTPHPQGAHIVGTCTCPVSHNCKHVAALLLEAAAGGDGRRYQEPPPAPRLPSELTRWLGDLDALARTSTEEYPPDIRHRLFYVLSLRQTAEGVRTLGLRLQSVRLLKDGTLGQEIKGYDAANVRSPNPAKYLRPSDHAILRDVIRAYGSCSGTVTCALEGAEGCEILRRIVATGRCRWESAKGPMLELGEPRPSRADWSLEADGRQRFDFHCGEGAVALPVSPPWYLDLQTYQCGPLQTGLPDRVAAALLSAPPVPPSFVGAVREELAKRFPDREELLVRELPPAEHLAVAPVPHLRLFAREMRHRSRYWYIGFSQEPMLLVALARPTFDYAGTMIGLDEADVRPSRVRDGTILQVERDLAAEQRAVERLFAAGFVISRELDEVEVPADYLDDLAVPVDEWRHLLLDFVLHQVPALRADGWQVEIDDDWPLKLAEAENQWTADVHEGSGIDWFEFDVGVVVDGERLNLLPILVEMLKAASDDLAGLGLEPDDVPAPEDDGGDADEDADTPGGDELFVPLPDGRYLPLSRRRLQPLLMGLLELYLIGDVRDEGPVRLPALRAADLVALEDETSGAGVTWRGGDRIRELGRKLADFTGIAEVPVPEGLRGDLRTYQREGLNWLQFLRAYDLNGILADDMGLGKTVQTLAHLMIEKESGRMDRPCLVIAPTSLVANWRLEAERFAPGLRVLTLHGPQRKDGFAAIPDHDLVLTSYALLRRDREVLGGQEYHVLVLDEAQAIKNPRAAVTQDVRSLRARHRLCLTGTPLENHLGELWSIMDVLNPGLLGARDHFARTFRGPIEKRDDGERRDTLRRRVRPFLLRRTKLEVERDLPSKTEIIEHVELETAQRDLYESIRVAMHKRVRDEMERKGLARSHIIILDALLKLRQVCCDPRLVKLKRSAARARSAKLRHLMDMLPAMVEEGRRVLLFSQFTSMLALIEDELNTSQIPFARLTGDTVDRETPVRRFQAGEVPLFLISLKAGGFGLNLTAADTVIHYDPWWNPAVEAQATDRAHRIGQDKPVFVYKLITMGTVEQKIVELQDRKRDLADALFAGDGGSSAAKLTHEDLDQLFSPLD